MSGRPHALRPGVWREASLWAAADDGGDLVLTSVAAPAAVWTVAGEPAASETPAEPLSLF